MPEVEIRDDEVRIGETEFRNRQKELLALVQLYLALGDGSQPWSSRASRNLRRTLSRSIASNHSTPSGRTTSTDSAVRRLPLFSALTVTKSPARRSDSGIAAAW